MDTTTLPSPRLRWLAAAEDEPLDPTLEAEQLLAELDRLSEGPRDLRLLAAGGFGLARLLARDGAAAEAAESFAEAARLYRLASLPQRAGIAMERARALLSEDVPPCADMRDLWADAQTLLRAALEIELRRRKAEGQFGPEGLSFQQSVIGEEEVARFFDQEPAPLELDEPLARLGFARLRFHLRRARAPALPLARLVEAFQLTDDDVELLYAVLAGVLSRSFERLYRYVWSDFSLTQPTARFLVGLLDPEGVEPSRWLARLAPDAPLIARRILLLTPPPRRPSAPLRLHLVEVDEAIVAALEGRPCLAAELAAHARLTSPSASSPGLILAPTLRGRLEAHAALLAAPGLPLRLVLVGEPGAGRRAWARALADAAQRPLLELALPPLPLPDLLELVALASRDAQLHDALLLISGHGRWGAAEPDEGAPAAGHAERLPRLAEALARHPGPLLLSAAPGEGQRLTAQLPGALLQILGQSAPEESAALWRRALEQAGAPPQAAEPLLSWLAALPMTPGVIEQTALEIVAQARLAAPHAPPRLELAAARSAADTRVNVGLSGIADRITSRLSWEDVSLPEDTFVQINEILTCVRYKQKVMHEWGFADRMPYGKALTALFHGPPGTGKTLLACVLANELGMDLYRVDLSRVTSKYIGETEKNLSKVFDAASNGQAIILFDEADSLFAKRTEVKSSTDRYANLEVNYLLQRMEHFEGVTLLTTNYAQSIDEAFQRRIRFKVEFRLPDVAEREALWRALLPPQVALDEPIRFDLLARMAELSGAHIRNAVLRAAFNAASEDRGLLQEDLVGALKHEAREVGLLLRT